MVELGQATAQPDLFFRADGARRGGAGFVIAAEDHGLLEADG
jgi:hypothetical protein